MNVEPGDDVLVTIEGNKGKFEGEVLNTDELTDTVNVKVSKIIEEPYFETGKGGTVGVGSHEVEKI